MTKSDLEKLSRDLVDRGKMIEAGWVGLRIAAIPLDAPDIQIDEMRSAFFAGARHLFSSIMTILEPDAEPTDKDMERMSMIEKELGEFIQQFELKHFPARGSA